MNNKCLYCEYWGYNNKKPMNSIGSSYCLKLKQQAHATQTCKNYTQQKEGNN